MNKKRGDFLYKLRKDANLNQDELGKQINYSRNNISKWENGISFPSSPDTLVKLSEILNVSVEELLYGERRNNDNNQSITNNLFDEYKIKHQKYRSVFMKCLILILMFIIVIMLFLYFYFIKSSISLYTLFYEDDIFHLNNSTLMISNDLSILKFNKIECENESIESVRLYYVIDGADFTIFTGNNDDYFIEEINGYKEYNLDKVIGKKIYLDIYTDKKKYSGLEITLIKNYENNRIFPKNVKVISDSKTDMNVKKNVIDLLDSKMIDLNFKKNDFLYEKKFNNGSSYIFVDYNQYDYHKSRVVFLASSKNYTYYIKTGIDSSSISYKILNGNSSKYDFVLNDELDFVNCDVEYCNNLNDYISYVNFIKYEVKQISETAV